MVARTPVLDLSTAVVVDFPLRGEWTAINTPAERVPSHGTDYFGQRYAYDFAQLDPAAEGLRFHRRSLLKHLLGTVPASAFLCWGQPVYSAFAGRVVAVGDGWPDRMSVNALWELARGVLLPPSPRGRDYRPLAGNFVIVEGGDGIAGLYAHLRRGTIAVREDQRVSVGTPLGAVGNSGNSTMPHLHFHVMDGLDPLTARGRLCAFRSYERLVDGAWEAVACGVPNAMERLRAG